MPPNSGSLTCSPSNSGTVPQSPRSPELRHRRLELRHRSPVTAGSASLYGFANVIYSGAKIRAFDDTSNGTRYGYTYDDNGRLTRATAVPSGSGYAVAQNFDEAYGFTASQWPPGSSFGNVQRVTTFGADGSSTSRDYDHADDRVTAVRIGTAVEKSLQYDDAGRVALATTGTSSRQTAYDVEDHLTAITPSSGLGEILAYDPTGTLMFRRVGTRVYYYTGSMTITGDVSASCAGYGCTASNVKVEVHIVAGATRLASIRAPAPSSPAAIDSDILYYHHDRQGSVVATTRNGGLIGERYRYTPYGALDKVEVVNANAHSDLAYLGGTQLSGSLLHLGARAYDPELRRFLQPDVVDLVRYGYGAGDPRNMMDPSGYMPISEEQQVLTAQLANLYSDGYDVFYYSRSFDRPLDELPAGMHKALREGAERYERQIEAAMKALGDKKINEAIAALSDDKIKQAMKALGDKKATAASSRVGSSIHSTLLAFLAAAAAQTAEEEEPSFPASAWVIDSKLAKVFVLVWQWFKNEDGPRPPPPPPPPFPPAKTIPLNGPPPPRPPGAFLPIYPWFIINVCELAPSSCGHPSSPWT